MTNHLQEGNLRPERSRNLPELHTQPASGSLAAKSVLLTTTPHRLSSPGYGTCSGCRHTRFTSRSDLMSFQCDGEVGRLHRASVLAVKQEDNRPYLGVTVKIKESILSTLQSQQTFYTNNSIRVIQWINNYSSIVHWVTINNNNDLRDGIEWGLEGDSRGRGHVLPVADSRCCMAKTNTTLSCALV